jgi:hypothetical protein
MIDELKKYPERCKLSDMVSIRHSPILKSDNEEDGVPYFAVSARDIPESGFIERITRKLHALENDTRIWNHELQPYDVLIPLPRRIRKVGLVPEILKDKWLPSSYLRVLRPKENKKEIAIFLYMFLRSKIGQILLDGTACWGAALQQIFVKNLKDLKIPCIHLDKMEELNQEFIKEMKIFKEINELKSRAKEIKDNFLT